MKTNRYYRCVSHLKNQDEVEEEISSIYAECKYLGQRVESIVVIPQCTDPKYPTLPTNYMISYIYVEEV